MFFDVAATAPELIAMIEKILIFKKLKSNFLLKMFHGNFKYGNFIFEVQDLNHRFLLQIVERFWQKALKVTEMGLTQFFFPL